MLAVRKYFRQCNVVFTMPGVCGTFHLQRCELHPVFTGMPHFWTLLRRPNGLQHRTRSMTRSGRRELCDILHAVLAYQGYQFVSGVYCSTQCVCNGSCDCLLLEADQGLGRCHEEEYCEELMIRNGCVSAG